MNRQIMVSIVCNTYNHEQFIREALNGFIMQKTSFPYEVLIHDDASTDKTVAIVKEFEKKYPDIIKPFFQEENQYSKYAASGDPFVFLEKCQYSRITGKYVAMCEGDDFWIDPYKLQKQFDIMEKHSEIDMCAHSSYIVRDGKRIDTIAPRKKECIIPVNDVILGGGGFIATSSIFYRASMREHVPDFAKFIRLDYSLQIWGALRGGLLYLPEFMSCYRVSVPGSWSFRMKKNTNSEIRHINKVNDMLKVLNRETGGKYVKDIKKHIAENQLDILVKEHKFKEIRCGASRKYYKKLPMRRKVSICIKGLLQQLGFYN